MVFNFEIKKTAAHKSLRILSFPLFAHADFLSQLFLYLSIISSLLIGFSFFGFISQIEAIRILIFFIVCFFLFLEIYLFSILKIKYPKITLLPEDALSNMEEYNIAETLDLQAISIAQGALKISRKRKLPQTTSEALLYAALVENKDVQTLMWRLGIDVKKLQNNLNNHLEKLRIGQKEQGQKTIDFSESFQKIIIEALKVAKERGRLVVGDKELLVALSKEDSFFKDVLVEHELKPKDIDNITLWLDSVEERIEKSKKFWLKENLLKSGSLGKDFASGFTITLDQFGIDWREIVSKNVFGEIIGHKKEIEDLETILAKSSLSNALFVGEEGVGKKSIIEALAQRCYLAQSLPGLNHKRVVELDMVALLARIEDQEKLEVTLDQIFQEALSAGNVILVIDNLDRFVENKGNALGIVDISAILSKYLPLPNFQFVGITSFDGLHQKIEQNPSFLEYFRKIEVSEISEIETIRILQNLALSFEQKYRVLVLYPTIREIVNLTARYLPSVPFPKKAIDVLDEVVTYVNATKGKLVEPHHAAKIISDKTQIPVGKMEFKEKSVLMNLEKLIHQRIVNQEEAVSEISIAMRRARAGIGSKKRPMGVFLFLGPTGVGKTETAKALAEIYFGGEGKMIRIDMSEFQTTKDIPRLIGGENQQGLLTVPVRENPFSLVLLDEIEKAHPNLLNLFLQVFDEGYVTDGRGRKIVFTNTIIICTSNAGANLIFKEVAEGRKVNKETLLELLFKKNIFRPEFINRFDATVTFHPLTKANLMDIAQLMLENLAKNLKEKDITFTITEPLKEKVVELSYKPQFGAREMRRVVQDKAENEIAKALLSDKITKGDSIELNPENFEIIKIL